MSSKVPSPDAGARKQPPLRDIVSAIAPLGWTAFGGPQAHIGLLQQELVAKRGWTDERTFAELLGLCSMLPGPTSTQMIIGLGAIRGGLVGAVVALLTWMFPASLIATFGGIGLAGRLGSHEPIWLAGAQPAAIALVALAAWNLGRRLVTDRFTAAMLLLGAVTTLLSTAPATFPVVLLAAGVLGVRLAPRQQALEEAPTSSAEEADVQPSLIGRIPRALSIAALALFVTLLIVLPVLRAATGWRPLAWFDTFYRAGSLVFGGGQVLLGVLLNEVTGPGWISQDTFLNGLSLVQALPGPLFSIAGFVGGALGGVGGALVCLAGIFLPGFLLMIGLLPFWDTLRHRPTIKRALVGINACAIGLIVTAALTLYNHAVTTRVDAALLVAAFGAAAWFRVPAPFVIVGSALVGWPLHAWLG